MLFRRIVLYAVLVGALSGLLLTAVQFWQVIPIIHSAERFENESVSVPAHDLRDAAASHEHDSGAWQPAQGAERTGFTLLANLLIAVSFALLILPAIIISRKVHATQSLDWRYGLLWGGAGYAIFYLAPTLGLPPEIPGAPAAPLEARQLWWLLAVVCTAAGLAGAAFGRSPWRWAFLGLLVVPHLLGAPGAPAEIFAGRAPDEVAALEELTRQFYSATAIANAIFWLALGLISVWATRRILVSS